MPLVPGGTAIGQVFEDLPSNPGQWYEYLGLAPTGDPAVKEANPGQAIVSETFERQGAWDVTTGVFPGAGAALDGWLYIVTGAAVAGTAVGGETFFNGDTLLAVADNASTATFAPDWVHVPNEKPVATDAQVKDTAETTPLDYSPQLLHAAIESRLETEYTDSMTFDFQVQPLTDKLSSLDGANSLTLVNGPLGLTSSLSGETTYIGTKLDGTVWLNVRIGVGSVSDGSVWHLTQENGVWGEWMSHKNAEIDEWMPITTYVAGNERIAVRPSDLARRVYQANSSRNSTATFDPAEEANWTDLGPAPVLDVASVPLPITYPGDNGAVVINLENDYYLDETIGTIPAAVAGSEYAIGIVQANVADAQGVKDVAKVEVSHFRAFDTGVGFIWLETASVAGSKDRVFADDTTVAPVATGAPTIAEIKTWADADTENRYGTLIKYNGTDADTDTPTRVYWVDNAGDVTLIETLTTLSKNLADFTAGDFTLDFFNDDPSAATDGKYYPNVDPNANLTLPTVVGNNGKRILWATDWAARAALVTPPTYTTVGAETISLPTTGWPAEGTEFVWMIADEANSTWLVRTSGNIELSYVVPTFDNDAEAVAGTVPGSLFMGSGIGDLTNVLYMVRATGVRVTV